MVQEQVALGVGVEAKRFLGHVLRLSEPRLARARYFYVLDLFDRFIITDWHLRKPQALIEALLTFSTLFWIIQ